MDCSDTIEDELQQLKIKQNAEIEELVRALQDQATITPRRAGTKKEKLNVNNEVRILNRGKYKDNQGRIVSINEATHHASIELSQGQRTNSLSRTWSCEEEIR